MFFFCLLLLMAVESWFLHAHGAGNPAEAGLSHPLFQQSCLRLHLRQFCPQLDVLRGKKLQLVLHGVLLAFLLLAISESCAPVLGFLPLPLLNRIGTHRRGWWLLPLVFLLDSSGLS